MIPSDASVIMCFFVRSVEILTNDSSRYAPDDACGDGGWAINTMSYT
jgi:hypothetical protein